MTVRPLTGKGIVITRPAHQSQALARLIEGAGGRPVLFPVIEIRAPADPRPFLEIVDQLDAFDLAIFISPNAVHWALKLILQRRALPPRLRVATVGGASPTENGSSLDGRLQVPNLRVLRRLD